MIAAQEAMAKAAQLANATQGAMAKVAQQETVAQSTTAKTATQAAMTNTATQWATTDPRTMISLELFDSRPLYLHLLDIVCIVYITFCRSFCVLSYFQVVVEI